MSAINQKLNTACDNIKQLLQENPPSELHQLLSGLAANLNTGDEVKAATAFLKLANTVDNSERRAAIEKLTELLQNNSDWITLNSFASDKNRSSSLIENVLKLIIATQAAIEARYGSDDPKTWPRALVADRWFLSAYIAPIWKLKCRHPEGFNLKNYFIDEHTTVPSCGGQGVSFGSLSLDEIKQICNSLKIRWAIRNANNQTATIRIYLPNGAQTVGQLQQQVEKYKQQLKGDTARVIEGDGAGHLRPKGLTTPSVGRPAETPTSGVSPQFHL